MADTFQQPSRPQSPRKVGPLQPKHGPQVSHIEREGSGLITVTGATLPPVCVDTGQVLDLKDCVYEMQYLSYEPSNSSTETRNRRNPFNAKSLIRVPFSPATARSMKVINRILPLVAILDVGGFSVVSMGVGSAAVRAVVWAIWLLAIAATVWILSTYRGCNLKAKTVYGDKLRIDGLHPDVLDAMVRWQEQHSPKPEASAL